MLEKSKTPSDPKTSLESYEEKAQCSGSASFPTPDNTYNSQCSLLCDVNTPAKLR